MDRKVRSCFTSKKLPDTLQKAILLHTHASAVKHIDRIPWFRNNASRLQSALPSSQPKGLSLQLKEYQLRGLSW